MNAQDSGSAPRSASIGRSLGAILAGFAVNFAALAVDVMLHATNVYPPWNVRMSDGLFVLAFGYRLLLAIGGGYVTARRAPQKPMKHALILGVMGTLFAFGGAFAMRNSGLGPDWYGYGLAVIAIPASWVGAMLYLRRGPK